MKSLVLLCAVISADVEFPAGVYPTRQEFKQAAPAFRESIEQFPRVVYFAQKSCPPCGPRWDDLLNYAIPVGWTYGKGPNFHLQYCDVEENPDLARQAGLTQTPSIALVERSGIGQAIPYTGRADFVALLKSKASAANLTDLTRVGCKLRPDLGSGVNTEFGVITCWHCVSSGKPIEVECDGESARGTVVAKDETADVALIAVEWTRKHPTVSVASGYPSGPLSLVARGDDGLIMVKPSIEVTGQDFDGKLILSRPSVSKQSGGGYIDANGQLAGIVSGNIAIEPFKGLMIPASAIRRILPASAARQSAVPEAAPTPYSEVVRVIGLLPKPQVRFVEFGTGSDARWCVAAVERWGCKATGIEIDHDRAEAARQRVRALGLDHLITIVEGDAVTTDVPGDVAACYLYQETLDALRPKLERMTAFASYHHRPTGIAVTQNGDSWIYSRPSLASQQAPAMRPAAVWGGQQYSGPVCSNPHCQMCNSIRRQLGQR